MSKKFLSTTDSAIYPSFTSVPLQKGGNSTGKFVNIDRLGHMEMKSGGESAVAVFRTCHSREGDRRYIGNFGGPHDARMLPDGTLTLHDNGANMGRPPRAVRYRIDTVARTATLLEQVTDPKVADAWCCGSARRLHNGNWVMGWGHTPAVTEIASDGNLVFRMNLADEYFSYRAHPVPYGKLRRADLRAGMDYMYPPRIKN